MYWEQFKKCMFSCVETSENSFSWVKLFFFSMYLDVNSSHSLTVWGDNLLVSVGDSKNNFQKMCWSCNGCIVSKAPGAVSVSWRRLTSHLLQHSWMRSRLQETETAPVAYSSALRITMTEMMRTFINICSNFSQYEAELEQEQYSVYTESGTSK